MARPTICGCCGGLAVSAPSATFARAGLASVGNRTGMAPGNNVLEVELGLEKAIPSEFMLHAHHWLILHGRYICLARKPRCDVCVISDICRWPEKTV